MSRTVLRLHELALRRALAEARPEMTLQELAMLRTAEFAFLASRWLAENADKANTKEYAEVLREHSVAHAEITACFSNPSKKDLN